MLTSILQPTHMILVLIVALLVLGPKRLPEAGRALGQGLKEFKSCLHTLTNTVGDLLRTPLEITQDSSREAADR